VRIIIAKAIAKTMISRDIKEADSAYCPAYATLNLLNRRWNLHIVRALLDGKKRFNELSRELGINPRTMSSRLRYLECEGLVSRTVVSENPPNVVYELTEKGRALNCIFEALADWGRTYIPHPDQVR
jgi:DNA-binding HxlR family transcriptional regulator